MREQNTPEDLNEVEVELSDLDPHAKKQVLWSYLAHHRLQVRAGMILLIVVGVMLLTVGVLPPFLRQVAPQSTRVAGPSTLPSTYQSFACRQPASTSISAPSPIMSETASSSGAMMWFQGQLITSSSQPGRCVHLLVIPTSSAGGNTMMWQAGP